MNIRISSICQSLSRFLCLPTRISCHSSRVRSCILQACSLARKICAISLPQALDLICFSHFLTESNWPFRQIRFGDCLVHANPTPASWNRAVGPERGWLASPWGVFAERLPSGGFTSCITQVLLALLSIEAMDRISGYRASFKSFNGVSTWSADPPAS